MLKAIAILPCKDEEKSIKEVILGLRKSKLDLEIVGIDDASMDSTNSILQKYADKTITLKKHESLAEVIRIGLRYAIKKKPDLIIHIDVDGQYDPKDLKRLLEPIFANKADIVIGDREVLKLRHMPFLKKAGNIFFSMLVSFIINKKINDSQSGFRVIRYHVATNLKLVSSYTYTHEEIIRASYLGYRIIEVPISFRRRIDGESRLISHLLTYGIKALLDIIKVAFAKQDTKSLKRKIE